jgi:hypothetical protein
VLYALERGGYAQLGSDSYRRRWYLASGARELGLALLLADFPGHPSATADRAAMWTRIAAVLPPHLGPVANLNAPSAESSRARGGLVRITTGC